MAHIRLGFPLDFISQNQSRHNMPMLPQYKNIGFGSPLEDGLTLYWPSFFLNVVIMQLILVNVFFVIYSKLPKTQKFFRFLSVKYISIMLLLLIVITFGAFVYLASQTPPHISPEMYTPPPVQQPLILPIRIPVEE